MIWFCFRMNSVANLMIYKQFVRLQHVKTLKCRFYVISSHIKKHVSGQESPVSENAKKHMACIFCLFKSLTHSNLQNKYKNP